MEDGTIVTPSIGNEPATPEAPDFSSVIPEGFAEKTYMKEIDSFDKLFNQLDNAQTMLGKRGSGIPQESASEEEWSKFFNEVGRPATSDLYEFNKTEGFERDSELEKSVKELMFNAGLSADQAKKLQTGYDALMIGMVGKSKEAESNKEKTLNEEFESMTKKHFGDRQDEALETSKKLLAKLAPVEFQDHIAALDNKSLVAMAVVLDAVNKKYITEDTIDDSGDGSRSSGMTKDDMRTKAREMMRLPEFKDEFHPKHEQVNEQIQAIHKKIAQMK